MPLNKITNNTKAAFRTLDEREVYAQELIRIALGIPQDRFGIPGTLAGCFAIINATEHQRKLAYRRAKATIKNANKIAAQYGHCK